MTAGDSWFGQERALTASECFPYIGSKQVILMSTSKKELEFLTTQVIFGFGQIHLKLDTLNSLLAKLIEVISKK